AVAMTMVSRGQPVWWCPTTPWRRSASGIAAAAGMTQAPAAAPGQSEPTDAGPQPGRAHSPRQGPQDLSNINRIDGQIISFSIPATLKVSSKDFFGRYADQFNLGADDELRVYDRHIDTLGHTLTRFQQFYKGVKVIGAQYVLIEDANGVMAGHGSL